MKVNYSKAKNRVSSHCISWTYRKKRYRKYFKSRLEALRFQNEKEQELGILPRKNLENEMIFWLLSDLNDKIEFIEAKIINLENSVLNQEKSLLEIKRPPPKILRIAEAAKVLRVSSRKLYYLLDKGVLKDTNCPIQEQPSLNWMK